VPMSPNDFHIDVPLTNFIQGLYNPAMPPIARKLFSVVPVNFQSGLYYKINTGSWYRDRARPRPLTGGPEYVNYGTSTATYWAEEYILGHRIDDRVRANQNIPWVLDQAGARMLTLAMQIRESVYWASAFFKTGVWGYDVASVTSGAVPGTSILRYDQPGSNPVTDIWYWKERMQGANGFTPNVLAVGNKVWTNWINHPVFVTRLQYTSAAAVTVDMMKNLMGLDDIVPLPNVYNTSLEGQSDSFSYITAPDGMWLGYRGPSATLDASSPTAGIITPWTGLLGGAANGDGVAIMTRRDEERFSDSIIARSAWGQQQVWPQLGVFFSGVVPLT
jgi:hypothetical protein